MEYLDSLEKNQAKECVKQEHVQARQQEQLSLRGRAQQRCVSTTHYSVGETPVTTCSHPQIPQKECYAMLCHL